MDEKIQKWAGKLRKTGNEDGRMRVCHKISTAGSSQWTGAVEKVIPKVWRGEMSRSKGREMLPKSADFAGDEPEKGDDGEDRDDPARA